MRVYLDNGASTRVAPEVIEAMLPFFSEEMGNAQSVHSWGQAARAALENARRQVAALINADPTEVVFTSGGTEADNLAVRGIAEANAQHGKHVITTRIEHPAVLASCASLEGMGFTVTYLPVSTTGLVSVEDVRAALRNDTILVSVMLANNEIGAIQPVPDIAKVIAEVRGNRKGPPYFHTDAVQAAGKIPVDANELGADLLSLSSHKLHGPKGVGALFVRKGTRLGKLIYGGHHERDRRAGTENVPGIVGFGRAAELARTNLKTRADRMRELRDYLEAELIRSVPGVQVNGDQLRIPNVLNVSFRDLDGEALLIALDLKGVAVSTGAACASGSLEPSHVLTALGLDRERIRGSLRLSLGAFNSRDEIDYAIRMLVETVEHLRSLAPGEEWHSAVVSP